MGRGKTKIQAHRRRKGTQKTKKRFRNIKGFERTSSFTFQHFLYVSLILLIRLSFLNINPFSLILIQILVYPLILFLNLILFVYPFPFAFLSSSILSHLYPLSFFHGLGGARVSLRRRLYSEVRSFMAHGRQSQTCRAPGTVSLSTRQSQQSLSQSQSEFLEISSQSLRPAVVAF